MWLDELRDSLDEDHRRWRSRHIEGLAPLNGSIGPVLAAAAEHAFAVLRRDLRKIRGDEAIPPCAVVAITPISSYISFTSSYFPEEGAFATSGGLYLNEGESSFPLLVISGSVPSSVEATVAHELTHHALVSMDLPLWAEEGLTQMMEQRVTGVSNFMLDERLVRRHRAHWDEARLQHFIDGSAFASPEGDEQELAYHLAQWIVRSLLTSKPEAFFAFARECRKEGSDFACSRHLGSDPMALAAERVGL